MRKTEADLLAEALAWEGNEMLWVGQAEAEELRNHSAFVPVAQYVSLEPYFGEFGCVGRFRYGLDASRD